jgi:hypothetical protein
MSWERKRGGVGDEGMLMKMEEREEEYGKEKGRVRGEGIRGKGRRKEGKERREGGRKEKRGVEERSGRRNGGRKTGKGLALSVNS